MIWRGGPGRNPRATPREAGVYELAGAILGALVMAALLVAAYARYSWNPAAWNRP